MIRLQRRSLLLAAWPWAVHAQEAPPRVVPRRLQFARDHGAHPEFSLEWWYATGSLRVRHSDELLGFQLTFFRSRTGLAVDNLSRFAARQLLFAHMALTDVRQGRMRFAERMVRWTGDPQAPRAAARLDDTAVHIGDWRFERSGDPGPGSRYRARLGDPQAGFSYDLTLTTTQPVMPQGDAGVSHKGPDPDQTSYYYSQPQLEVAGTLVRGLDADGGPARRDDVQGLAWLDHEWSEVPLHPDAVGWDWIGMNLTEGPLRGGALMAFRHRRADGSTLWAAGSFRAAGDAAVQVFAPDQVRFTPGRHWMSPTTQTRYPVQWQVQTPAGRFEVEALLDAQEIDSRGSTGAIYWEGLSELRDAAGRKVGRGYLELTGYASKLRVR